jgi:hypothetical protein
MNKPPAANHARNAKGLCNTWQRAVECRDEMRPFITQRKAARLEGMPNQEIASQGEAVGKIAPHGPRFTFAQESRKTQHLVGPGFSRTPRYRTAGFWRYVCEISGGASRRTTFQIKTEPEFGQQLEFKADNHWCGQCGIVKAIKYFIERFIEARMGVAFRQKAHKRSEVADAIDCM